MSDPPTPNAIASSSKLPLDQAEILSLPPSSLTPEILHSTLLPLADIDALTTCSDLLLANTIEDPQSARCIVQFGLARGESDLRRIETEVRGELHDSSKGWETWSSEEIHEAVARILAAGADNERILRCCETISEADKRLETFEDFFPSALAAPSTDNAASGSTAETGGAGTRESETGEAETIQDTGLIIDDPWEEEIGDGKMEDGPPLDDPWDAAGSEKSASVNSGKSDHRQATPSDKETPASTEPPILLSAFLSQPLLTSALSLAAAAAVSALQIIRNHHPVEIFPYRFALLEALPGWTPPGELESAGLLPQMGVDGMEKPWSPIQTVGAKTFLDVLPDDYRSTTSIPTSQPDLLTSEALSQWYAKRIYSLDSLGLLDVQLGWVQFGASLGVPGLDAFGEDLSLLSRLIYDANLTAAQQDRWNLVSWRAASECEVVKAYLSNSSEAGVVEDIKRLVLPYLYVLESRAERAGNTDSHLPDRLLYEAILGLSLHLVLPVFEASKATLPKTDRLVKNDLDVARLALACLYGSDQREIWTTMSAIFECLPVWDVSGGDIDADKEATATTLDSIATFVRPSRAGAQPPTAHDFFIFFSPLPFAALSRALDILDVHLESGEILARWDTAVQPRFLLQSARNTGDQTELAERMVRRQSSRGLSETRWTKLWGDMRKLNGGDDALLRGAFGMLSAGDMMRIYLGGVLGSGQFDVAKRMIRRLESDHGLSPAVLEEVVLATSREFYDNAETGSIHTGDMKRAYDSLSVVPASATIRREREFIEATSKVCSYNLSITPAEIRHSKDRLNLIRRVLSSHDDAHRHAEIVFDLTDKLGYRGDTGARIDVLAMLADAAVQATDFEWAFEHCQAMVLLTKSQAKSKGAGEDKVCWKTCLELGHQSEYADVGNKMTLLGWAIELCPPESIPDILGVWRKVEDGQIRLGEAAKRRRLTGIDQARSPGQLGPFVPESPREGEERVLGSRTAARAARLAKDFGERFNIRQLAPTPLVVSEDERFDEGSERRRSGESDRPIAAKFDAAAEGERVRKQARRAVLKGVGWLLGAEEKELSG